MGGRDQHYNYLSSLELLRYPPSACTLLPSPPFSLPLPLFALHCIVIGSRLFVIQKIRPYDFWSLDLESLSTAISATQSQPFVASAAAPSTLPWQQLPSMPTPPHGFAFTALDNDTLVAAGGLDSAVVESYSISQNRWQALPPLQQQRYSAAAVRYKRQKWW